MGERVDFEGTVLHTTANAYLVDVDGDLEGIWLPISQIEDVTIAGDGITGSIPEWLAVEKGLA